MLKITIPACSEQYDEVNNMFINDTKEQTLLLEHSLVSLSKWESKWHKPYLSKEPKTIDEFIDYVRCMTITQNVDPNVYTVLTIMPDIIKKVSEYIEESMTATTFPKDNRPPNREIITAEIIYYWMISYNIPFECQKWHLSRLLTLINVCSIKNAPQKKMSNREILSKNRALNEARKRRLNTKG